LLTTPPASFRDDIASASLRTAGMQLNDPCRWRYTGAARNHHTFGIQAWGRTRYGRRRMQIEGASLMSLSPSMLLDSGNEATADGFSADRKKFLAVIGVIGAGFVLLHLIVLHSSAVVLDSRSLT